MNYPEVKVLENVKAVLKAIEGRSYKRVYLIACGGSSALMYPSQFLIDTKVRNLTCEYLNSNEFIYRNSPAVNEEAIVILCSQEGKTPETVAAAKYAREKGATVITIAMLDDTPLQKEGEFFVKYGYYETADPIDTSYGVMYLLTAGILQAQEGLEIFDDMVRNLENLKPVVENAKKQYQDATEYYGKSCREDRVLYSLASGCNYSQSYVFCNCYMMEMQWINAIPIHAGEFFHGPFEIIEKNSPVIMLMGLDQTRFMEERALRFLEKYTDRIFRIDMKDVDFMDVDEDYRGYLGALVINNICRMFSKAIAKEREHSLDIRRYMHLVEY
ncbi:MAG: SIS domain-containing protein [Clostridiales bacterium]|nr:SIS domain-containing protein [Clostridiales bacterium]